MEIYEQYLLSTESGFNKGNFLSTAIILGNPLTGEWAYAQLVENELLEDLVGDSNAKVAVNFLAEVKANINSRSQSDPSAPTATLFGNPWLLSLASKYGESIMVDKQIHVAGEGTGQAILNAYTHMQERMEGLSDQPCECNHD